MKLIFFFALIAAAYSQGIIYKTALHHPAIYGGIAPDYFHYRGLPGLRPLGIYPEGVDPNKCPNYPICDTLDKPLIKSYYAPAITHPLDFAGVNSRILINAN